MSSLFSILFAGLFVSFVIAAIIGHALVIEALVRPFFGKLTAANPRATAHNSPLPHPTY